MAATSYRDRSLLERSLGQPYPLQQGARIRGGAMARLGCRYVLIRPFKSTTIIPLYRPVNVLDGGRSQGPATLCVRGADAKEILGFLP